MFSKNVAIAMALVSAVTAAPADRRQDDCQDAYNKCIAAGTPQVKCSCDLTTCSGEDSARIREFCATATASLTTPTSTSIPGGCNPAHPGSCPSSTSAAFTSISGIPGGCNPAHPGSCPSSYFSTTATATATATFTSISGIPGGCNPAHPGSCPSSYFSTSTVATPTVAPTQPAGGYPSPKPVAGKTWSIKNLTRYCGEDNSGCDYNFSIETVDKTEQCTVIRMPGSNAATESWSNEPCTTGSEFVISWGYATNPGPPFAVITVVDGKELAWFGVSDVNGQKVTPSNPFGSGNYGNLDKQQVYTY